MIIFRHLKKIQSFYDSRKKKTKRCQDIQKILKKENLPELKKQELRREYVTNTKEMRDEYITIQKLVEKTQPFKSVNKPTVIIKNENYKEEDKRKKTTKAGKHIKTQERTNTYTYNKKKENKQQSYKK